MRSPGGTDQKRAERLCAVAPTPGTHQPEIIILRAYSFYQFLALGSHLVPRATAVQPWRRRLQHSHRHPVTCILMTLFRKGLIRDHSHAFWYTTCLIFSHTAHVSILRFPRKNRLRVSPSNSAAGKVHSVGRICLCITPAIDEGLQSMLAFILDTLSRGDGHTLYGETAATLSHQWNDVNFDGITTSGLQYWQTVKSNMASGYASVKTIDYGHMKDLGATYKLTAVMLAVFAGMWVRGRGADANYIFGGILRSGSPSMASSALQQWPHCTPSPDTRAAAASPIEKNVFVTRNCYTVGID